MSPRLPETGNSSGNTIGGSGLRTAGATGFAARLRVSGVVFFE
jgi:hypothetical protein